MGDWDAELDEIVQAGAQVVIPARKPSTTRTIPVSTLKASGARRSATSTASPYGSAAALVVWLPVT
jgi:hypothetical protein